MTQNGTPSQPAPLTRGPSTCLPGESITEATRRLGYQPHGRGADDRRGSPRDRKIRKLKILGALPIVRGPKLTWGGDGTKVPCAHCAAMLTFDTLTVDRIDPFGPYTLANVQAACRRCNTARGCNPNWIYRPAVGTE